MITLNVAVERLIARSKIASCRRPSIVRLGSLIAFRQAWLTGWASDGAIAAKMLRTLCGAVGARSGAPVCGLSQAWTVGLPAFALRKERSSRKNSSRFLPHLNDR